MSMVNMYGDIFARPRSYRQLTCGKSLITMYNCPLENKFQDLWSEYNYIVYVLEGRKVWHTGDGAHELSEGDCVLVRKGACIVEQFQDVRFCLVLFFIPDDFITDVIRGKSNPLVSVGGRFSSVINISMTPALDAFYKSMYVYFESKQKPDEALLRLKFHELILQVADNPDNDELLAYFHSMINDPCGNLRQVMEDNYCFNLSLDDFAKLTARSLSAFKRDFMKVFQSSPGKWLMQKRLDHALHLLTNLGKTVSDAAFESGFESSSHFSRVFRERFGSAPLAMKNAQSKRSSMVSSLCTVEPL